ncbi:MAG: hypothetical protein K0S35_1837 [Geminicoccaceae bacterium]|jgi:hypothetical protein|nr:hypothetical protein [Geminicoccaceae bacterium]
MTVDFEWFLGTTLILIHALGRFNRPRINRLSTTCARFYFAAFAYCAATFLLYVLLAGLLTDSPGFVQAFQLGGALPDPQLHQLKLVSGPLMAALALTVLLPNFPVIAQLDERLLRFFQMLGNIPLEAILLSEQLYRGGAAVPSEMREEMRDYVHNRLEAAGITEQDLDFEQGRDSPRGYWTLLLALVLEIDAWRSKRTYARVFDDLQEEHGRIDEQFEKLSSAAARYFKMVRELPPGGSEAGPFFVECKRNFRDQCDELYRELCRFVARGVLKCEWTRGDRNRALARLGFKSTSQDRSPLSPDQVVTVIGMLFVVLLIAVTLIGSQNRPVQYAAFISIMVATIYGAAIVCAVLFKGRWPTTAGQRPVLGYLVAGLAAGAMAAVLSVAFKSLLLLSFYDAVLNLRLTYPYLVLAFMAALTTSFCCDDFADLPEAPWFGRWLEGIGTGAVLSGTGYFVWQALDGIHKTAPALHVPELPLLATTTALIGTIIGITVPTWYRRALQRQELVAVPATA